MTQTFFFDTKGSIVEHSIDAPVFAVKAFERGYYPIYTPLTAEQLNKGRYSVEVLQSALEASVFGWNVPAAQDAVAFIVAQEEADARELAQHRAKTSTVAA